MLNQLEEGAATVATSLLNVHENPCELSDCQTELAEQETERQRLLNKLTQGCKKRQQIKIKQVDDFFNFNNIKKYGKDNFGDSIEHYPN